MPVGAAVYATAPGRKESESPAGLVYPLIVEAKRLLYRSCAQRSTRSSAAAPCTRNTPRSIRALGGRATTMHRAARSTFNPRGIGESIRKDE